MKSAVGTILSISLTTTIIFGCACPQKLPDPPNPPDKMTVIIIGKRPDIAAFAADKRIPSNCPEHKPEKADYEAKLGSSEAGQTVYVCHDTTAQDLAKFGAIFFDLTHGLLGPSIGAVPQDVKTVSLEPIYVSAAGAPTGATMVTTTAACHWETCKWTGIYAYWKNGLVCSSKCN
jgi:hypothetical protein